MKDFRNQKIWQLSHDLTMEIYRVTARYPDTEREGLIDDLRDSAMILEASVEETALRGIDNASRRYPPCVALGKLARIECMCTVSKDLKFLTSAEFARLNGRTAELRKLIWPTAVRRAKSLRRKSRV